MIVIGVYATLKGLAKLAEATKLAFDWSSLMNSGESAGIFVDQLAYFQGIFSEIGISSGIFAEPNMPRKPDLAYFWRNMPKMETLPAAGSAGTDTLEELHSVRLAL